MERVKKIPIPDVIEIGEPFSDAVPIDLKTKSNKRVKVEEKPENTALIQGKQRDEFLNTTEAQGDVEEIEEMFSSEGQTESSILKELFTGKNVKLKTDVSEDDISIISRLYFMSKFTKQPMLSAILDEFITLRVSKDRKSRQEFVEAHKDRQTNQNKGLLGGLFGGQGGG